MKNPLVAMVQINSRLLDKEYNLKKGEALIRKAKDMGADIVCLPETFALGYYLPKLIDELAAISEDLNGQTTTLLKSLAKELKIHICAGVVLKDEDGGYYNSALLVDDNGEIILNYNKNHLFGGEGECFLKGDKYSVCDTKFGKIGVIICYDNNFPESVRINALMGAKLILCPCAWRAEEKDVFKTLAVSHAMENTLYFCAVNMSAKYYELNLFGGSLIANPRGKILAECKCECEDIALAEIDFAAVDKIRNERPFLKDRRPMLYGALSE